MLRIDTKPDLSLIHGHVLSRRRRILYTSKMQGLISSVTFQREKHSTNAHHFVISIRSKVSRQLKPSPLLSCNRAQIFFILYKLFISPLPILKHAPKHMPVLYLHEVVMIFIDLLQKMGSSCSEIQGEASSKVQKAQCSC